jgi:sulfatase modifying factor 1
MATMYTQVPRAVLWLLRGDEFSMGELDGSADARPVHALELGSFYISRGPISNVQYEAFSQAHTRHPRSAGDDDPAIVSWHNAHAYANWYAALSNKDFRLPTEAEWEFAARAMGQSKYPWGAHASGADGFAWTSENSDGICHPVDTPRPSKAGLYSMIGNVWEWTSSAYRPYPISPADGRDEPELSEPRVIRGGSILDAIEQLSCGRREHRSPDTNDELIGFRIVRAL